MPSYTPPLKNSPFVIYVTLQSQVNNTIWQINPTIALGDFKISIDGGAFANLATLPVVTPALSSSVKISLSAAEMNGDNILIIGSDIAGAEWSDIAITIQTATDTFSSIATQIGVAGAGLTNIGDPRLVHLDAAISTRTKPADTQAAVTSVINPVTLASGQVTVKKNSALNAFSFLMISSADHITPKTGLTITAQRSIDGAAFANCANPVTELSDGFYLINLAASDLNGNIISLKFTAIGADQRSLSIVTQT